MTTAERRPTPTPRDLAHRPAPAPLAPPTLLRLLTTLDDGSFLVVWYRGVDRSSMGRAVRLVGAALAELADPTNGQIPAARQPFGGPHLAEVTGLHHSEITLALNVLRTRAWIRTERVRGRKGHRYERCRLVLTIPSVYLPALRESGQR